MHCSLLNQSLWSWGQTFTFLFFLFLLQAAQVTLMCDQHQSLIYPQRRSDLPDGWPLGLRSFLSQAQCHCRSLIPLSAGSPHRMSWPLLPLSCRLECPSHLGAKKLCDFSVMTRLSIIPNSISVMS